MTMYLSTTILLIIFLVFINIGVFQLTLPITKALYIHISPFLAKEKLTQAKAQLVNKQRKQC